MIIYPNVKIPSFPLLGIKGSLPLLEPCIFENFECGEERRHSAEAICFSGPMPVFHHREKGAHQIEVRRLRTEEIDQRAGKRINYYRTLGSRILPDLRRQIK